ncbi:hypothetical protein [Thermomonas sp.]|uniref:hypothetical protein n=1 Tax=Thermomonas sp. TaxID=1971895 RepID=UPI002487983D|nr:hypothetical protein [Thermomonas sp.]MDI1251930.1 hypothetical protein [Thermomonas sp.]
MKPTLPVYCLVVCMAATLVACERTPPAPVPTAPAPKPTAEPAKPAPPSTTTEPTTESAAKPGEQTEDWVLPGSLGPLTTRLELEARFGKVNLHEETLYGAEGNGSYPVLVVFPDDPRKRLELVQDADNPDAPIQELRVPSPDSLWHDSAGLHTGMTLAELVALNGAPVSFYGLDWDYGGVVQDWHGGKLANAVDASIFRRVALVARKGTGDARLPHGDASFRSDDNGYPTIGKDLVVGQLGISWPHEGED